MRTLALGLVLHLSFSCAGGPPPSVPPAPQDSGVAASAPTPPPSAPCSELYGIEAARAGCAQDPPTKDCTVTKSGKTVAIECVDAGTKEK